MPACLTANVFADAKENTDHEITGDEITGDEITGDEIMEINGVFWRDITLNRQPP
jgi:uncharacterized protein involved in tellurium resistance